MNKQKSQMSITDTPAQYKQMIGTWLLDSSDNFHEFMTELGVSPFLLFADEVMKPIVRISYVKQLDQFKMEMKTTLKSCELMFKVDEEFCEITGDGRRTSSKITIKDNVMTHVQNGDAARGEKTTEVIRTFIEDSMYAECTIKGPGKSVRCTRLFHRIPERN